MNSLLISVVLEFLKLFQGLTYIFIIVSYKNIHWLITINELSKHNVKSKLLSYIFFSDILEGFMEIKRNSKICFFGWIFFSFLFPSLQSS